VPRSVFADKIWRMYDIEKRRNLESDDGRLKRPWSVFFIGMLASAATLVVRVAHVGSLDTVLFRGSADWLLAFGLIAFVLSATYAVVGSKFSLKLARQIVGLTGLFLILAGVALIAYELRKNVF
jgi:hypothetical protein